MDEPTTAPETIDKSLRVITVRMPRALHEQLKTSAHGRGMSVNKLCCLVLDAATTPPEPLAT